LSTQLRAHIQDHADYPEFSDSVVADAMQVAPGLLSGMMDEWPRFANQQTLDFGIGFWQSLADHPLLNQFVDGVGIE
jgi:hypothetical protein